MHAVIESVVTAMVNGKIASADDSLEASVSDRPPVVIDARIGLVSHDRRAGPDSRPMPRSDGFYTNGDQDLKYCRGR